MNCELEHKIFSVERSGFEKLAVEVFHFQYENNSIYRKYCKVIHADIKTIDRLEKIPFLPIQFFKTYPVKTTDFKPQVIFESSGTTSTKPLAEGNDLTGLDVHRSTHHIKDISLYRKSFLSTFERFYGPITDLCVIGLLPSYLERQHSSLVFMVNELLQRSQHAQSGFYVHQHRRLKQVLQELEMEKQKTMLIGVTFALLDFAEKYPGPLMHTTVMETGGMKGRRKELTREEVHALLKDAWGLSTIHSEYGMTELLSQAYSSGDGIFCCPPWMRIMIRQEDDPFVIRQDGNGVINVIDLANIYSCCFIATDDIGKVYPDRGFEVAGRIDNSDIRGCSLMSPAPFNANSESTPDGQVVIG